jgi:myo-inositol-1(or 4)-monophosphatase
VSSPIVEGHEAGGREVKLDLDRQLSELLINNLQRDGVQVISEESEESHAITDDVVWIIDPLDGSFNYLRNAGPSAICCALLEKNSPVLGVIFDLSSNQLYWGGPTFGSFCNDFPLTVSRQTQLSSALVYTGLPSRMEISAAHSLDALTHLLRHAQKVRMIGSAAISLAKVASGIGDVYSETSIMPWDVAAGVALVEGAGGLVLPGLTSRSAPLNITAGNPELVRLLSNR